MNLSCKARRGSILAVFAHRKIWPNARSIRIQRQLNAAGLSPRAARPQASVWALSLLLAVGGLLQAPSADGQTQPTVGQDGKDVPWVPTPDVLVDTMLEMAAVTADDRVIDLGSGDGRMVIAAARLGARATGVEFEKSLVELSTRSAAEAGVANLTEFVATDLFGFDLSPATVITMFLLPDINYRLRPTLFALTPGTRIVSNTWDLSGSDENPDAPGWTPYRSVVLDPCPTCARRCCGSCQLRSKEPGVCRTVRGLSG